MSDIGPNQKGIGSGDVLLRRTGRTLGQSWEGAKGSLAGDGYRIYLDVTIPVNPKIFVKFPGRPRYEVNS